MTRFKLMIAAALLVSFVGFGASAIPTHAERQTVRLDAPPAQGCCWIYWLGHYVCFPC